MQYEINDEMYTYIANFRPLPNDYVTVTFYTRWAGAQNPTEIQKKFQMTIRKQDVYNLGHALIEQGKL